MQDLHAKTDHAVEMAFDIPRPGRLIIVLRVRHDQDGNIDVRVVDEMLQPTGADIADDLSLLMTINMPDSERRLIGMAGVVEMSGVDEQTIDEYRIAGDFPAHVQIRGCLRNFWWLHEVREWCDSHVISGEAENYSLGARRRPNRHQRAGMGAQRRRRQAF
jgi:predicted DNA-binding transcriptional regulator AlpA